MPTLPLCCDTESCQKILKSLHELGDGSCNYLSYCLAAASLLLAAFMVGSPFVCPFSSNHHTEPAVGASLPRPLVVPGQEACSEWPCGDGLVQFLGEVLFLLAQPQAWFCTGQLDSKEPGTGGWQRRARTPRRTHQRQLFVFVCVAFFSPSLLAPSELEQCRQLQALPVLHLLPKTSSK